MSAELLAPRPAAVLVTGRDLAVMDQALSAFARHLRVNGVDPLPVVGSLSDKVRQARALQLPSELPIDALQREPVALSSAQAAAIAGMTTRAITDAATQKRLPGERIAGRWYFAESDVAEFARRRRR